MSPNHQRSPRFGSSEHITLLQEGYRRLAKVGSDPAVRDRLTYEIRRSEESLGLRVRQGDLFCFDYERQSLKAQLSHAELVALADLLDGWVRTGQAPKDMSHHGEALRGYAAEVGIRWKPPTPGPKQLSLMAFLAKKAATDNSGQQKIERANLAGVPRHSPLGPAI